MIDRRPMGAGSIEERGDRFRVRLRVSGRKQTLGTYPTRDQAEAVLGAALDQLEAKRLGLVSAITLRDWAAKWLPARELSRAVRDSSHDGVRLSAYVLCEPWADDPLETVSQKMIRAWMLALLSRRHRRTGKPLSRATVVATLSTLRVCFRGALDEGLLDANPCDGVRVPKMPRDDEPWTYLSTDEVTRLTSSPRIAEPARLMYAVAIYTGLRKGELWGLRWRDVQLEHVSPHVMVRRSRSGPTKTGKHRAVPLLPAARAALTRLRELDRVASAEALVFPFEGEMRARANHAGWRSRWKVTDRGLRVWQEGHREIAGIDRPVRFHDLRHTCASHLRMGSWTERPMDLGDIQAWLGHSSQAMSLRYAHLAPDYLLGRAVPKPAPAPEPPSGIVEVLPGRARNRMGAAPACDDAHLATNGAAAGPLFEAAVKVLRVVDAGEPVERLAVDLATQVIAACSAVAADRPTAALRGPA